jgi:hypothetical protein
MILFKSAVGMLQHIFVMSKEANFRSESTGMCLRSVIKCVGFFMLNVYGREMYGASFCVRSLAVL